MINFSFSNEIYITLWTGGFRFSVWCNAPSIRISYFFAGGEEKKRNLEIIYYTRISALSLSFPFYLCTNFFSLTESHRLARVISIFEIACRCSTTWYPLIIYFTQKLNRVSSKQFLLILLKMYRFYHYWLSFWILLKLFEINQLSYF